MTKANHETQRPTAAASAAPAASAGSVSGTTQTVASASGPAADSHQGRGGHYRKVNGQRVLVERTAEAHTKAGAQ